MAALVARTKKLFGKIAQRLYDVRLVHAELEVSRHRAFLGKPKHDRHTERYRV